MKYRHFISIDRGILPDAVFETICSLAPFGRTKRGFRLTLDDATPDGGDTVRKFVAICEAHGLRRRNVSTANSYGQTVDRWYDEEKRQAEFLVLNRQIPIQSGGKIGRGERGRLLLADNLRRDWKCGSIFPNFIIISQQVRRILENDSFRGMRFNTVALRREPENVLDLPFFELQSSIVLPKMSNIHQFIHPGRTEPERFEGDYGKIIMLNDPPFNKGEVHYRQSDLEKIRPFDIAKTFENYMEPHPALIVSQRFYHYCLEHEINLMVDPVRIDPG